MKSYLHSRDGASKGAAIIIVLAMVVLLAGLCLAYFSRTTTERALAQSSYNDTSADLLARSALDIVVTDFKQEILTGQPVSATNIRPTPYPIPTPADIPNLIRYSSRNAAVSRASNVSSADISINGHSISPSRWNSHYLIPRLNTGNTAPDSTPVASFTSPDWVLVTAQGPRPTPSPSEVIGRYAFAVYDEGGLLDMTLAGNPSWSGTPAPGCDPMPTPWQLNVGHKGSVILADLTALAAEPTWSQSYIDKIVGWRNYATTQRTFTNFPTGDPGFSGETDCAKQDSYGSYVLDFGEPPFAINSYYDVLFNSVDPVNSVAAIPIPSAPPRTDQNFMTRQELLKLRSSLGFSQNVLQYMGTYSRARNRPAPDWPWLSAATNALTERWNMNNLDLLKVNPCNSCQKCKRKKKSIVCDDGKKKKKKGTNCGDGSDAAGAFGLWWTNDDKLSTTGYWVYVGDTLGTSDPCKVTSVTPPGRIKAVRGTATAPHQNDFFQVLHFGLWGNAGQKDDPGDNDLTRLEKTFSVGASIIDQYDSDDSDLALIDKDGKVPAPEKTTHTTAILFSGNDPGKANTVAFGMETGDVINGKGKDAKLPERPKNAPNPGADTRVLNHAFSEVGEFGFAIDSSQMPFADKKTCGTDGPCPTLNFYTAFDPIDTTGKQDPRVMDLFSYNPVSSAYPRAGIVNLNTRNVPVLAAILQGTILTDATFTSPPTSSPTPAPPSPTPPTSVVSSSLALTAAQAIVNATSTQPALTRADVARLVAAANAGSDWQQKEAIARALAEVGGTRSWSLFIDVIAQTGKYKPNAPDLTGGNFVVEGEKRYWLHIALGRDLVHSNGTPCLDNIGCQVDVLGTQLEEVVE